MAVYPCWHRNSFGYTCRTGPENWMFVPELGQPDSEIYKNLSLDDLTFKFAHEKSFEMARKYDSPLASIVKSIVFPRNRSRGIASLLLTGH